MTDLFNTPLSTKSKFDWLTPPSLIHALGEFDLDPCSPIHRPWDAAKKHYTIEDNGLTKPWHGRVWLNPPYGKKTFQWLSRLAEHKSGVALIFARTETSGFHKEVWGKAESIFFFEGRISFFHANGTKGGRVNAPSCLISYSRKDSDAITDAGFRGKHVFFIRGKR